MVEELILAHTGRKRQWVFETDGCRNSFLYQFIHRLDTDGLEHFLLFSFLADAVVA